MGATNSTVTSGPPHGRYRGDWQRLRQLYRSIDRDEMLEETPTPAPRASRGSRAGAVNPESCFIVDSDLENEATAEPSNTGALSERFPFLDQCVHELSILKLEGHVKTAGSVIDNLGQALRKASDAQDASRFLATIECLKSQETQTRTVVGVVGDTGSGKSSIVNALLDEEMIVPTNCMRACTSVITELSYNYSDDPEERYRAEVEFITPADWKKELTQLSRDLLNNVGEVVRESTNTDTEAGVSWAKIKAVYPEQTKGGLANMNIESISDDPRVKSVLGSKHIITKPDAGGFFETMQQYIDSEVETQNRRTGSGRKLQYWPLIKVVRMFVKADVLSTGAVIVDLPGVQDSNAARAAVAENYIKNCKYVWVVAPITRAVDDKTARKLMGESFKLQLKLDGKYDRVSFICSKIDDISVVEASNSFRLDEEISACQQKLRDMEVEVVKGRDDFKSVVGEFNQVAAMKDDVQEQLTHWQKQLHNLVTGLEAQPYSTLPLKRRGTTIEKSSLKKPRLGMDLDAISLSDSDSESDGKEIPTQEEVSKDAHTTIKVEEDIEEKPLTIDQVWKEINKLQAEKLSLRRRHDQLEADADPMRRALKQSRKSQAKLQIELKSLCIQSRNEFCTAAIKQDFSEGLRESDQDLAMRENEQSFDPQNERRDYEAISSSFPVFCVSSKVYQMANGRFKMDEKVQGFPTQDSTGIPRLREYAKKLTESAREDVSRRYMKDFRQFIQTLSLWTQKHGSRDQLNKDMFKSDLDDFERQLEQAANATTERCRGILSNSLYDKFDQSSSAAAKAAMKTGEGWFGPRNTGGFAWNTYSGVHSTRSAGQVNLNEDLALPLKRLLANSWELVFTQRIPTAIAEFPVAADGILERFHNNVKGRIPDKDQDILRASLIENVRYTDVFARFQMRVTVLQREANRGFTPTVTENMKKAYRNCAAEGGPGMYSRMREITLNRIKKKRNAMFRQAANGVRTQLDTICEELESELFRRITQSIKAITLDFESGIIGSNLAQASKAARVEIRGILSMTDAVFEAPADGGSNDGVEDATNIVHLG